MICSHTRVRCLHSNGNLCQQEQLNDDLINRCSNAQGIIIQQMVGCWLQQTKSTHKFEAKQTQY